MQPPQTPRFQLPLLATGQAQKELFHNEALILLDFLVHPVVLATHGDPSTLTPLEGQAWLIDLNPAGEWEARANQIAVWTAGGWRFVEPNDHAEIFASDTNEMAVFQDGSWLLVGTISGPQGGSVVDVEARSVINSILSALRSKAVIEG